MNPMIKSSLSVILLVIVFLVSIFNAYNQDAVDFCDTDSKCIIKIIQENNLIKLCDRSDDVNYCYNNVAFNKNSVYACSKTNESDKCIYNLAIRNNEPVLCENSFNSSYCYYSYAINTNNLAFCANSDEFEAACLKRLIKE